MQATTRVTLYDIYTNEWVSIAMNIGNRLLVHSDVPNFLVGIVRCLGSPETGREWCLHIRSSRFVQRLCVFHQPFLGRPDWSSVDKKPSIEISQEGSEREVASKNDERRNRVVRKIQLKVSPGT
jgi:hypothetical protein